MQESVHIFLADDDADERVVFQEALRGAYSAAELSSAGNGNELLQVLNQTLTHLPRLVFLDLNMPIKNGHDTLQTIRATDNLKHIPVFVYSTSEDPTDIEMTFTAGADHYITKPPSFTELKYIIKRVVTLNRTTHQAPRKEDYILRAVEHR